MHTATAHSGAVVAVAVAMGITRIITRAAKMPKRTLQKVVLTYSFVQGLKYDPDGRNEFWDAELHHFGIQISKSGYKSYVLYTRVGSKSPTRLPIGNAALLGLAAARAKAKKFKALIAEGKDPRAVAKQEAAEALRAKRITFAKVAQDWLDEVVIGSNREEPKQRKGKEVEQDLYREFFPRWGTRPIAEITAIEVRDVIKEIAKRAPAQARNLLGYCKRLFAWARDQGPDVYGLESSPAERWRAKALIGIKVPRTRVLDDTELRALWHAAGKMPYPHGPMFQMLVLTGQRRMEVAGARWREIDLTKKLWVIPPNRMKSKVAHVVPLNRDVLALLEKLPRYRDGDHVFSGSLGVKPVASFSKCKRRLDHGMAAELAGGANASPVEPFTIHDVRRTMRTHLSALPITDLVRELVIAHTKPGLHKVYDQWSYVEAKRHALNLWEKRLRSIVSPPAGDNVVVMERKQ